MPIQLQEFGEKHKRFINTPITQDPKITILSGSVRSGETVALSAKLITNILCRFKDMQGIVLIIGASRNSVEQNVLTDLWSILGSELFQWIDCQSGWVSYVVDPGA